jgi:hypothetical protein
MTKDLLLRDYKPISMLNVASHDVPKPKFPLFDFHVHFGPLMAGKAFGAYDLDRIVPALKEIGIFGVINLKLMWGKDLEEDMKNAAGYEDFVQTFASVDVSRIDDIDFAAYVDETFRGYKSMGIKGLKMWKDIGLYRKDAAGKYYLPDDDRLRPIWEAAGKYGLIVLIHVADPKAFFTPVDAKKRILRRPLRCAGMVILRR